MDRISTVVRSVALVMSRHACADIWIVISASTSARFRSLAYLGAMRSQVVASSRSTKCTSRKKYSRRKGTLYSAADRAIACTCRRIHELHSGIGSQDGRAGANKALLALREGLLWVEPGGLLAASRMAGNGAKRSRARR